MNNIKKLGVFVAFLCLLNGIVLMSSDSESPPKAVTTENPLIVEEYILVRNRQAVTEFLIEKKVSTLDSLSKEELLELILRL